MLSEAALDLSIRSIMKDLKPDDVDFSVVAMAPTLT